MNGRRPRHSHRHAFAGLNPTEREGLVIPSLRNMVKAGLGLPDLLRHRAESSEAGRTVVVSKAVIHLWMADWPGLR